MNPTVIIPSCDDEKVMDCVSSLVCMNPSIEPEQIVIVSDGLSRRTRRYLREVKWVEGSKPFVFSRAINMGAEASLPGSDLLILGDDVRFLTKHGIDRLVGRSYELDLAAIAPEVYGLCGQSAQRAGTYLKTAPWLAFICVLIRRRWWEIVGPLDERFIGYGYDDVDWCARARKEMGALFIDHDVSVHHIESSSYRSQPEWTALYEDNRKRFEEKWQTQARGIP